LGEENARIIINGNTYPNFVYSNRLDSFWERCKEINVFNILDCDFVDVNVCFIANVSKLERA